jgi:WD40-like Beta Propeller Repeat
MAPSSLGALAAAASLFVACDGRFVNLGASAGARGGAGGTEAAPDVWEVASDPVLPQEADLLLASPTLDERGTLFFSAQERYSTEGGEPKPTGVWRAEPTEGSFGEPVPVPLRDLAEVDVAGPAVSWSGRELWLGRNVDGSTDVFRCSLSGGVCSAPERVAELSSRYDDAPRPPTRDSRTMPLSSKRHGGRYYQLYLSERDDESSAWSEPSQGALGALNSGDFQSADGFLSDDGLTLYFASTRDGDSDLFVARRASAQESFGAPQPLSDLNTGAEERMPWVSPDGARLYFVSNRATARFEQYALFVALKR